MIELNDIKYIYMWILDVLQIISTMIVGFVSKKGAGDDDGDGDGDE